MYTDRSQDNDRVGCGVIVKGEVHSISSHSLNEGLNNMKGSRCWRADSVLDSHTTGPGFKTRLVRYFLLSFRLLTTMTASS